MTFENLDLTRQLFGEHNSHLQRLADALEIKIHARGNTVFIEGDPIITSLAEKILNQLYGLLENKYPVFPKDNYDHSLFTSGYKLYAFEDRDLN